MTYRTPTNSRQEVFHHATLLELLDIAAAGGAVLGETRRIVRQGIEKISQFLRPARRNIYAKLAFSQGEGQLAFRRCDRDNRFGLREETQQLAREKGIPGSGLLRNKTNVRVDEQGAIIPASLQREHADIRKLQLAQTLRERLALGAIAADQNPNTRIAQAGRGFQQHVEPLFNAKVPSVDREKFFRPKAVLSPEFSAFGRQSRRRPGQSRLENRRALLRELLCPENS